MQQICRICKKICKICQIKKHFKFITKYAKYARNMQCKSKFNMQNMHSPLCWWPAAQTGTPVLLGVPDNFLSARPGPGAAGPPGPERLSRSRFSVRAWKSWLCDSGLGDSVLSVLKTWKFRFKFCIFLSSFLFAVQVLRSTNVQVVFQVRRKFLSPLHISVKTMIQAHQQRGPRTTSWTLGYVSAVYITSVLLSSY